MVWLKFIRRTGGTSQRNVSALGYLVEPLERRVFLNATLTTQIPATSVVPGSSTTVDLTKYFSDPNVPGTLVDVTTPLGTIPIALTDKQTPKTVANFLKYVNGGE